MSRMICLSVIVYRVDGDSLGLFMNFAIMGLIEGSAKGQD